MIDLHGVRAHTGRRNRESTLHSPGMAADTTHAKTIKSGKRKKERERKKCSFELEVLLAHPKHGGLGPAYS
jgi:hypothetical protein